MIGYLKGNVQQVIEGYIILEVQGIGYRVELGTSEIDCNVGDEKEFYIYTHVRENELRLFGFKKIKELQVFEFLLGVSGVGPKSSLALVSQLGVEKITTAILGNEPEILKISGVGIKTANKIVLELADKLEQKGYKSEGSGSHFIYSSEFKEKVDEACEALKTLGYRPTDIKSMLKDIRFSKKHEHMSVGQLVKFLLSVM